MALGSSSLNLYDITGTYCNILSYSLKVVPFSKFPGWKTLRKIKLVSIVAPLTRKSLVKGERFIRVVWRT